MVKIFKMVKIFEDDQDDQNFQIVQNFQDVSNFFFQDVPDDQLGVDCGRTGVHQESVIADFACN